MNREQDPWHLWLCLHCHADLFSLQVIKLCQGATDGMFPAFGVGLSVCCIACGGPRTVCPLALFLLSVAIQVEHGSPALFVIMFWTLCLCGVRIPSPDDLKHMITQYARVLCASCLHYAALPLPCNCPAVALPCPLPCPFCAPAMHLLLP